MERLPNHGTSSTILPAHKWSHFDLLHRARQIREMVIERLYLRRCTRLGRYTQLVGRPSIHNAGIMIIGDHVRIHSTIVPVEMATLPGGTLEIGDRTFINYGVSISAHQSVRIGSSCLLGTYVNIMDNAWHDIVDRRQVPPSRPVILEDRVWLGNRVIVLPGVTIGHDSVVGAGSVVTKDMPARCVAAGNPDRILRHF